jgi:hypothetical protein
LLDRVCKEWFANELCRWRRTAILKFQLEVHIVLASLGSELGSVIGTECSPVK